MVLVLPSDAVKYRYVQDATTDSDDNNNKNADKYESVQDARYYQF